MEPHHDCTYDNVQIFDGWSEANRSLGRYCGSNGVPDPITSSTEHMFMVFYSDASVQRKGFRGVHSTGEGKQGGAKFSYRLLISLFA